MLYIYTAFIIIYIAILYMYSLVMYCIFCTLCRKSDLSVSVDIYEIINQSGDQIATVVKDSNFLKLDSLIREW